LAPRTPRGPRRALLALITAALAATVATLLGPAPAHADPSAGDLAQQVEQQGRELDVIMEQYNKVNVELGRTQAQLADVSARIPQLTDQVNAASAAVTSLAVHAYEGSSVSGLTALLTAGSPHELIYRLDTLNALSRGQQRDLAALNVAKGRLQDEKDHLDGLAAQQTAQQSDLAARKATIETRIAALKKQQDELARRQAEQARQAAARAQAAGRTTTPKPGGGTPPPSPPPTGSGRGAKVVAYAYAQLGKPYVFGAAGPSTFDCSGLSMMAWAQVGVHLAHSSYIQMNEQTVHIPRSQLQPGDLVFFYGGGHVGIYIGNGNVIHAPHTGDVVKISSIDWMNGYTVAGRPR
jgi:cell wall-associated NlpC family hydrolase